MMTKLEESGVVELPRPELGSVERRARDVASGPVEARDETDLHGITGYKENNGDGRGRRLGGERGRGGHREDEGYLAAH